MSYRPLRVQLSSSQMAQSCANASTSRRVPMSAAAPMRVHASRPRVLTRLIASAAEAHACGQGVGAAVSEASAASAA
eukprot:359219-Chlamydomonas_euryale.AAC.26